MKEEKLGQEFTCINRQYLIGLYIYIYIYIYICIYIQRHRQTDRQTESVVCGKMVTVDGRRYVKRVQILDVAVYFSNYANRNVGCKGFMVFQHL